MACCSSSYSPYAIRHRGEDDDPWDRVDDDRRDEGDQAIPHALRKSVHAAQELEAFSPIFLCSARLSPKSTKSKSKISSKKERIALPSDCPRQRQRQGQEKTGGRLGPVEKQAAAGKGFYGSVAFRHEAPSRKSPQQLEHEAANTPLPPDIKLPRLS